MTAPAVSFSAVTFAWSPVSPAAEVPPLLDHFDLHLAPGKVTAIVGPSGCGKSTLLKLAAGLLQPTGGRVDAGADAPGERAYVFQAPTLLPWRTVADNVGLPLDICAPDAATRTERIRSALERVELDDALDKLPHQLSGGMQMRASLARALVTRPKLLLLDEPFSALDAATRRRVQQVFARAWTAAGATVVMVTHDIDEAVLLADRVVAVGGRPLTVRHDLGVNLPKPRAPELRHDPTLGALVRQVESVL
jgi:ABC-type nitrate/sulfonate/bicarbonate transport system ATPase subunit